MQNPRMKLRRACCCLKDMVKSRCLWMCVLSLSLCGIIFFIQHNIKTVYIKDGETTILSHTLEREPNDILSEQGIAIMAFDVVDFTGFEGKMGVININRAFPVTLSCDGKTKKIMTTEISVRELLADEGIILNGADTVNIPKAFYLSKDDHVVVTRINDETEILVDQIPFETEYVKTPLLASGRQKVIRQGVMGEKHTLVKHKIVDGEIESTEVCEEKTVKNPTAQKVLIGGNVAASNKNFGIELDNNGNPKNYKAVLRNQVCTGYSSPGYKGASGMKLEAGCVAVRSNEIPYGTKLYIKSAYGGFIYGCAVAADTGLGLVQNVIDLDLYYDTYMESCLNGRKYLDVYIL